MGENNRKNEKSIYRTVPNHSSSAEKPLRHRPKHKEKKKHAVLPPPDISQAGATSELVQAEPSPEKLQANSPSPESVQPAFSENADKKLLAEKARPKKRLVRTIIALATCLVVILGSAGYFCLDAHQRALAESIVSTFVEASVNLDAPYIPNILEQLDFSALAAQETDATLKSMHEYFANTQPTFTNEYTGMFEGYNLIQITAESFTPYLLTLAPHLYPNLNRLYNEGFQFTNFHTPFFYHSTIDGEYVTLLSQLPITGNRPNRYANSSQTSMRLSAKNFLPQTTAHQLANENYSLITAYHNWRYNYYWLT